MTWTIPNILTLFRLALIPAIAYLIIAPYNCLFMIWGAFSLFIIASLSDFADGYIARKYNQHSDFGKCFDPIADKVLVAVILICLIADNTLTGWLIIPVILILVREILISGLREYLAEKQIPLPVSQLGKWKTSMQMLAISILILSDSTINALGEYTLYAFKMGSFALCISTILTILSGLNYLKIGFKNMKSMK